MVLGTRWPDRGRNSVVTRRGSRSEPIAARRQLERVAATYWQVARIGTAAREHVRQNFLITRHLGDVLALMAVTLA